MFCFSFIVVIIVIVFILLYDFHYIRPRTAWMDNIKTWTGLSVEESVRMTADRDKRRKYVRYLKWFYTELEWNLKRNPFKFPDVADVVIHATLCSKYGTLLWNPLQSHGTLCSLWYYGPPRPFTARCPFVRLSVCPVHR